MCMVVLRTVSIYVLRLLTKSDFIYTDVRTIHGLTPIHYACQGGHKETAQYLVEEGKCDVGMFIVHNYVHMTIH